MKGHEVSHKDSKESVGEREKLKRPDMKAKNLKKNLQKKIEEKGGGKKEGRKELEVKLKQLKKDYEVKKISQMDLQESSAFHHQGSNLHVTHKVTPANRLLALLISNIKFSNKKRNTHDHDPAFWLQNLHTNVVFSTP